MNSRFGDRSAVLYILTGAGMILLFALILFLMGQVLICKCGYVKLWHGIVVSSENSRHISDWYSFSHIIHGFAFYWILRFFGKWHGIFAGILFLAALFFEISWEIFENTDFIINRYREVTISLDYYGDSVINSVSDVLFMIAGFFIAQRVPLRLTMALIITMELGVGYFIRDNLTLNIIMLLYPFDAVLRWQQGG